ncbi:MAG: hypothetical protein IPF92_24205 [Myxococcales bacterium]|nr:hypothetical protein [Myxococcales bacterium]MBL0193442.1 hypothetical protein [Myxococcales bacterium]HQY61391.1 hypothetical protein [Polyangiaceae bacterium]
MRPTNQRDYYAKMYVAALLADELWNVYFPRRRVLRADAGARHAQNGGVHATRPDRDDAAKYAVGDERRDVHALAREKWCRRRESLDGVRRLCEVHRRRRAT